MSKVDEELSRRFHRAERPVGSENLLDGVARRRRRRRTLQRLQAGALAVAVLGVTAGGFLALQDAFGEDRGNVGDAPALRYGRIVFSAEGEDGFVHLYSTRPDGSDLRQITDFGSHDTRPEVSPDGRTIAFVHRLEGSDPVIATIPADGGTVTWLTDPIVGANDPDWAPDGSSIVFSGHTTPLEDISGPMPGLFVTDPPEGRWTPIATDPESEYAHPDWSPDGELIAYSVRDAGETAATGFPWTIQTITPEGVQFTLERPAGQRDEEAPTWSPDASRIAFIRPGPQGDEIWTIAPDGSDETLIATAVEATLERDLAWVPGGSSLLVSDGDFIYRVDVTPAGDVRDNFVQLVRGFSPSWQPIPDGSEPTATTGPEPSVSPSPSLAGQDIGIDFNLCSIERLGGIDWFGDGTEGTAWTGTPVDQRGRCGRQDTGSVVAADLDGDGIGDTWSPIDECIQCAPWAAIDLDGNGAEELVVLLAFDLEPTYAFYFAVPEGLPRSSGILPIFLEGPGVPALGLPAEGVPTVRAGASEEGVSGRAIRCEGYPEDPVLVVASWIEDEGTGQISYHGAKLRLVTADDLIEAHFEVVETFTPTATSEDYGGDGKACGVDFNPWN